MSEFGELLRTYRARGFDAERSRPLTQERLGELLGRELDGAGYTGAQSASGNKVRAESTRNSARC